MCRDHSPHRDYVSSNTEIACRSARRRSSSRMAPRFNSSPLVSYWKPPPRLSATEEAILTGLAKTRLLSCRPARFLSRPADIGLTEEGTLPSSEEGRTPLLRRVSWSCGCDSQKCSMLQKTKPNAPLPTRDHLPLCSRIVSSHAFAVRVALRKRHN